MTNLDFFQRPIRCTCGDDVQFETIDGIECDWGVHKVIQCPNCQELFSADMSCPAFQDAMLLSRLNPGFFSDKQKSNYVNLSHGKD